MVPRCPIFLGIFMHIPYIHHGFVERGCLVWTGDGITDYWWLLFYDHRDIKIGLFLNWGYPNSLCKVYFMENPWKSLWMLYGGYLYDLGNLHIICTHIYIVYIIYIVYNIYIVYIYIYIVHIYTHISSQIYILILIVITMIVYDSNSKYESNSNYHFLYIIHDRIW